MKQYAMSGNLAEQLSFTALPVETRELAPMLQHYKQVKEQYQDYLLLYQVGDFYEVFFDDAPVVSQILNIRLTSRDKDQVNPIPMCGVPIHALDNYMPRLLQAGQSCVLVSQVEDAKNKKGMVQREITRVVTPGVRYEGDGLDEKRFNYLAAAFISARGNGALAYVDVSTGKLRVRELENADELLETIKRVLPVELLLPSTISSLPVERSQPWFLQAKRLAADLDCKVALRPFEKCLKENLRERLEQLLVTGKNPKKHEAEKEQLKGELAAVSLEAAQAVRAVLEYVEEISFGKIPQLAHFSVEENNKEVLIDAATRRNLELTESRIDGDRKNSLLQQIDYTKTAMGSRLLGEWILAPSSQLEEIVKRHEAVEELIKNANELENLRGLFAGVRDVDRLVSRLLSFRAVPRDLAILRDSLRVFPMIAEVVSKFSSSYLKLIYEDFDPLTDVYEKLSSSLVEDPPLKLSEGGIFRSGFNVEVDRLRSISTDGSQWLLDLERRERERTGIPSLKVRYNNVFGYYIEIGKTHLAKAPADYQRKQTLVNAERFVTDELKKYEVELLSAKARQFELEKGLYQELRLWLTEHVARIQQSSHLISLLDVLAAFAHLARKHHYTRPVVKENTETIIKGGRHPVVERVIGEHNFVPNDTLLNTEARRLAVLTGPNMGGKSTYLRQIGLIQLLAQAGSFVPAQSAELGLVDRIFTRIGAADDLARGDSTFMVEMREAAVIVRRASSRSLVLIDEIGRGTATSDGLAIATAIAEWLHDVVSCRTIFATHFHELTELGVNKFGAFCLSVGVIEEGHDIIFTHRIEESAADRSYGIEVAKLAGLPEKLIERAKNLLQAENARSKDAKTIAKTEKVISNVAPPVSPNKLAKRIATVNLDNMTPIQALVELSELKELSKKEF